MKFGFPPSHRQTFALQSHAEASTPALLNTKWVPINRSFIVLIKIILRAAVARKGFVNAAITLRCVSHQGYRHLVLVNAEEDQQVAAVGPVEEFIISTETSMTPPTQQLSSADSITLPIDYQQQRLGYIVALAGDSPVSQSSAESLMKELSTLAGEVVDVVKRYETRHRAWYMYGDQAYWIGNSMALRQLDRRIEHLASSSMPVLIRGDKGTGKTIAARGLHCMRNSEVVPFIEVNCAEWMKGTAANILHTLCRYRRGDTLFVRNIDKLSLADFEAVADFWRSYNNNKMHSPVYFIFSLSEQSPVLPPEMVSWLACNTQELRLPDLNERADDLRDLALFFMHEFQNGIEFDFTEEAWAALENIHWQENVHQLKHIIYKVALTVERPLVPIATLQSLITP